MLESLDKFTALLIGLVKWVPPKAKSFENWKPVIRSSVSLWICFALFLIVPVTQHLGNASFFIVVVAVILPPYLPFTIFCQQALVTLILIGLTWLWAVIGCAIANAVRDAPSEATLTAYLSKYRDMSQAEAIQRIIFDGAFLSTKATVVFGVFLGVGSAILAWIKISYGPKYALQTVLSCILLDVICTIGPLIPSFAESAILGEVFFKPACLYFAVALLCCPIFGESVQHKFLIMLDASLGALEGMIANQSKILQTSPTDPAFEKLQPSEAQRAATGAAYQAMLTLKPTLTREISIGRIHGAEIREAENHVRRLQIRSAGLTSFHKMIINWQKRHKELKTAANAAENENSTEHSQKLSTQQNGDHLQAEKSDHTHHIFSHVHFHHSWHGHRRLHPKVAAFENIRLMDLENISAHDDEVEHVQQMCAKAAPPSGRLLAACKQGLAVARTLFVQLNQDRFWAKLMKPKSREDIGLRAVLIELEEALEEFRSEKRKEVLDPLKDRLDSLQDVLGPTRGLYYVLLHQFELIEFSTAVKELLEYCIQLDAKKAIHWQFPKVKSPYELFKFPRKAQAPPEDHEEDGPETSESQPLLDEAVEARNPDNRPPRSILQYMVLGLSRFWRSCGQGNLLFSLKVALVTILSALPAWLHSSAHFYYYEKGLWVLITAQLSLARFVGDTALQFFFRTVATFVGAVIGMVLWYIGSGSGDGNPYGLAAAGAVAFPFLLFYRINTPPQFMIAAILGSVTSVLIISYGYVDKLALSFSNQGHGWTTVWKRFVSVLIGVAMAFLVAFIPRPDSNRLRCRKVLARTMDGLSNCHMELLSYATRTHTLPDKLLSRSLLNMNNKLRTTVALAMTGAKYEIKAGPWPGDLYSEIQKLQLEISDLLGQLMLVFWKIEPKYREALLLRTRFLDPQFIGDVSAVYWLIAAALGSGNALPQITPCPLSVRATQLVKDPLQSLAVSRTPSRTPSRTRLDTLTEGIPQSSPALPPQLERASSSHVNLFALDDGLFSSEDFEQEGFMAFAAGVSLSFALIYRLDLLMIVVKRLVGESMQVRGLNTDVVEGRYTHFV